jgi:hypothetical protein
MQDNVHFCSWVLFMFGLKKQKLSGRGFEMFDVPTCN